jgi:hypothetical protein
MALIEWEDPYKWMEKMSGPRWRGRVARENKKYYEAVMDAANQEELEAAIVSFRGAAEELEVQSIWHVEVGSTRITIYPKNGGSFLWKLAGLDKEFPLTGDLDLTTGGIVVYSHEVGGGAEKYEITATREGKTLWNYRTKHGVSSQLAIHQGRVYFMEASSPIRYKWVVSLDLLTGKDRHMLYEEKDNTYQISLVRGERGCLFLISENAGHQRLYHLGERLEQLSPDGDHFHPVGFAPNSTEPCYFVCRNGQWEAEGTPLKKMRLPPGLQGNGIDHVILRNEMFIHRNHGMRFLCMDGKITKILGEIETNQWAIWRDSPLEMHIVMPGCTPIHVAIDKRKLVFVPPVSVYADRMATGMVRSADGSKVRWIVVSNRNRPPRAVIINGYGAYGMTTHLNTARWKPFLERGVAIGFALVRGGGDHNAEWAEAGRRQGKLHGIEDMEACVRAIQKVLGLGPKETCLFGRSAGGYLVGGAITRSPGGDLFGSVYTEVPYVDVLATASKPAYPLTKYEYREFGDPVRNIADFETMLRLGPVSGLGPHGASAIFVLSRVGMNDRQVYAYESVKWMEALKGDNLLAITSGQGHFTTGDGLFEERAGDFLILLKRILG